MTPLFSSLARYSAIGALAGFGTGLLAGGVGSRLAMRVSAIASGDDLLKGSLTDAQQAIGEITLGGSLFLTMLAGGIGVFGGLVYAGVRPFLGGLGRWKGLIFGVLLLSTFGWEIIEAGNSDFARIGPAFLNVAMFASLFILFGLIVAPLFDWIANRLPRPSRVALAGVLSFLVHGVAIAIAGMIVWAVVVSGFGESETQARLVRLLGGYCLVVPVGVSFLLTRSAGPFQQLSDLRERRGAMTASLSLLVLPLLVGIVVLSKEIREIFSTAS